MTKIPVRAFFVSFFCALLSAGVSTAQPSASQLLSSDESASAAVRNLFAGKVIRPLNPRSFEALRKHFSVPMQRKVDAFLRAFGELMARRDEVAKQAGMSDARWWPGDVDSDVRMLLKGDPLTNRALIPDKLDLGTPRKENGDLEIVVKETYVDVAKDGSDLGGTKECRVQFVRSGGRWVIDEIVFNINQYGRERAIALTKVLERDAEQLQRIRRRIKDFNNQTRPAVATTPAKDRANN